MKPAPRNGIKFEELKGLLHKSLKDSIRRVVIYIACYINILPRNGDQMLAYISKRLFDISPPCSNEAFFNSTSFHKFQ